MSETLPPPPFSKPLARLVGLAVVLTMLVHLLLASPYADQYQIELGFAQLLVLPIFAIGVLLWGSHLLPRFVTLMAFVAGFALTLNSFSPIQRGENEMLLARFPGDSMGAASRIFRRELRRALPANSSVVLTPYHFSINDRPAARTIAEARKQNSPFVWFMDAHIIVEFSPTPPRALVTPITSNLPSRFQNLRIVENISNIAMTTDPRRDTQIFLSKLISGIVKDPPAPGLTEDVGGETNLIAAATQRAGWRGLSHQAYAWWLLGNRYLWEAVSGSVIEPAHLECAFRAYARAVKMFRPRDNRELIAAIVNNQSVAMALQAAFANDPRRARKARNGFRLSKGYAKGISSNATQTEFFSLINGNLKQIAKRTPRTKAKIKKRIRVARGQGEKGRGHSRRKSERK